MKIDPFLRCLGVTGIDTGVSVLGVYSFSSGTTGVAFNQIYPTGINFYNGLPYRSSLPLIYNGAGTQPSGLLNKSQFYQVADVFNSSFSTVISMSYSGCLNTGTSNYLLASTNPNPTGTTSGIYLGITPTSRLFVKAGGYSHTIPQEIGIGDFAFFNVTANRFLNFGLYSVAENRFFGKSYDAGSGSLEVKDLCFGGALSYPPTFTGYSGKINEIYLFSGTMDTGVVGKCVDCAFATGYSFPTSQYNYNETTITGSYWTGIFVSGVTGTQKATSSYALVGGGSGSIYFDSGVSGSILLYQSLIPVTNQTTGTGYFTGINFSYDYNARLSGALFDVFFDVPLVSGDVVEIYTYPVFNPTIGINVVNFQYPSYSGEVQLFGNGLAETKNVDYGVAFNNLITGFVSDDILLYDLISQSVSMDYITGANYVQTGASDAIAVRITGAKNVDFSYPFKYDIYFNGQKMASGVDYSIVPTGAGNAGIVSNTNTAYNLAFYDINAINGDYLELKFVPKPSNVVISVSSIIQSQSVVSGISGFSEQVWVNGIRQSDVIDYTVSQRCRYCSGQYVNPGYSFSLYNSAIDTTGFFK